MGDKYDAKASDIVTQMCVGIGQRLGFDRNSFLEGAISSALRSAAAEERDLIQATSASDKPHCDQLHAAEWQTIETAPKDGTAILLWWRHCPEASVGRWDAGEGDEDDLRYVCHPHGWICDDDDCIPKNQHDCTHWMPLLSPPHPSARVTAPSCPTTCGRVKQKQEKIHDQR